MGVEDKVMIRFWCGSGNTITSPLRPVACPTWADIDRNYTRSTRCALKSLMAGGPPAEFEGRLIVWHGPPGTGKTAAIRALAREWSSWAKVDYIVDADTFFSNPAYVSSVVLRPPERALGANPPPEWRVTVVEDADNFLAFEGRATAGLSLLLNLTDGILAQGVPVLFLLTTNQRLARLNPAITRRGRVLSSTEFRPFSRPEAAAWLGQSAPAGLSEVPLCDLYAITRGGDRVHGDEGHAGRYL
ncbi:MAG TPA: AAA family ATPase [Acidimicrobiales bacterium]|nr:AAA family ATPase [Acidimicrobiales bacterium]